LRREHDPLAVAPGPAHDVPAARCLAAVAGPEDRSEIIEAARTGGEGARCTALRYLADGNDPDALCLIEGAVTTGSTPVMEAAVSAFERMRSLAAVDRARSWVHRPDALGAAAGRVLACRGGAQDRDLVLAALREAIRGEGPDAPTLWTLVDGTGRLGIACAAPVLRHIYRETASSHLRGRAARALAATDPSFAAGFAIECLWDCEETTRELAARHAETGDNRVVERLRRLAADPAEEDEVQTAVRSRFGPDAPAV
ncbi:HEAT repeat domain-containing protein, partial [Streptomyces sp. NPDC058848]